MTKDDPHRWIFTSDGQTRLYLTEGQTQPFISESGTELNGKKLADDLGIDPDQLHTEGEPAPIDSLDRETRDEIIQAFDPSVLDQVLNGVVCPKCSNTLVGIGSLKNIGLKYYPEIAADITSGTSGAVTMAKIISDYKIDPSSIEDISNINVSTSGPITKIKCNKCEKIIYEKDD